MQPCDENENYIFVSYAHRDSEKVVHIIELLSAQGFNIWYDDGEGYIDLGLDTTYEFDDDGKLEGKAAAVVSGDLMVVIEEDEDEIEVTYVDLTAAYILANA